MKRVFPLKGLLATSVEKEVCKPHNIFALSITRKGPIIAVCKIYIYDNPQSHFKVKR
jgi:hypothetical protein